MADNLPPTTPFDALRHVEGDTEYWSARELAQLLGYTKWQNFQVAVDRAITACEQSGYDPADHFIETNKKAMPRNPAPPGSPLRQLRALYEPSALCRGRARILVEQEQPCDYTWQHYTSLLRHYAP